MVFKKIIPFILVIPLCLGLFMLLVIVGLKNDLSNFYFDKILWLLLVIGSFLMNLIILRFIKMVPTNKMIYIIFIEAIVFSIILWSLIITGIIR